MLTVVDWSLWYDMNWNGMEYRICLEGSEVKIKYRDDIWKEFMKSTL